MKSADLLVALVVLVFFKLNKFERQGIWPLDNELEELKGIT